MEKLKRAYYYLFYKLYKFAEAAPAKWWSDWKAGVVIIVLELFLIASIINYYVYFIDSSLPIAEISNFTIFLCVLAVVIPNYFAFVHTDVWKEYVKEFDALPKDTNRKGNWIVLSVILLIIGNFIFSFYLFYQM